MNSEEQKLAAAAYADFCNKKYSLCLQHLALLTSLKPNNLKVLHNKFVVELFASNYKNIDAFQKSLFGLCNQGHIKILESDSPDDVDHCIIFFNQAVLYFHQKQYETALNILYKVFSLIQPMEEGLAHRTCLLLLELCSILDLPDKGLDYISSIENQFLASKSQEDVSSDGAAKKDRLQPFRLNILQYKARFYLRNKLYDACQKVLDQIFANKAQNFSTILMKAELYLLKAKYEAALDEIIVIQEDIENFWKAGDEKILIYYNNIAIIYYYNRKSHLSLFFMNKAYSVYFNTIEKLKKAPKENLSIKPSIFQTATFLKIMYNRGVAFLSAKKPIEAFDCFTVAVQGMLRSPLIWLRLAECCIMVYKKDNEELFNFNQKRKELVTGKLGSGCCAKICLNNKVYKDTAFSSEIQTYAVPMPSLEFATVCLRNSFALLPNGNNKLRQGVLAACSYVHLTIGDPVKAYKFAKLLSAEATSRVYKYLGRLYLAEALFMLNKFQEAIEILNPSHFADCDPTPEVQKYDWVPNTQVTAQAVLHYNLATLLVMKGDLDKASELLRHVWVFKGSRYEIPIHILALALYIELVFGRIEVARTIIKQNCPQIFASS